MVCTGRTMAHGTVDVNDRTVATFTYPSGALGDGGSARLDHRIAQSPDAPLRRPAMRIETDRPAHDVVRQLPRNGFALDVAAFRSELRQTVADGGFFVGRHGQTMQRPARSVQRLSPTAAQNGPSAFLRNVRRISADWRLRLVASMADCLL